MICSCNRTHGGLPGSYPLTNLAWPYVNPKSVNVFAWLHVLGNSLPGRVVDQHWAVVEPMSSRADWVSYHYYVGLLKISEDKVSRPCVVVVFVVLGRSVGRSFVSCCCCCCCSHRFLLRQHSAAVEWVTRLPRFWRLLLLAFCTPLHEAPRPLTNKTNVIPIIGYRRLWE